MTTPGRRALAVSCVLGAVLAVPADARADGELGLSRDGTTWSDRIQTPLFDSSVRWVPGDERTATFYVRNQATGRARLAVDLAAGGDPGWVSGGGLDVSATVDGGGVETTPDATGWRLTSVRAVPPGRVLTVRLTVSMPASATDVTQERTIRAGFTVALAQDLTGDGSGSGSGDGSGSGGGSGSGSGGGSGSGDGDGDGSGGPGEGVPTDGAGDLDGSSGESEGTDGAGTPANGDPAWLPGTGGPPGWLLLAGGLLVGVGSALVRDRRGPPRRPRPDREHDQHHDQQRGTR